MPQTLSQGFSWNPEEHNAFGSGMIPATSVAGEGLGQFLGISSDSKVWRSRERVESAKYFRSLRDCSRILG